jgi:hypothetical protein
MWRSCCCQISSCCHFGPINLLSFLSMDWRRRWCWKISEEKCSPGQQSNCRSPWANRDSNVFWNVKDEVWWQPSHPRAIYEEIHIIRIAKLRLSHGIRPGKVINIASWKTNLFFFFLERGPQPLSCDIISYAYLILILSTNPRRRPP